MRRAGFDDDALLEHVLGQLRQHQLLDDTAFAQYWVEQRQTFRPRGARLLRAELAHLGVERAAAQSATAEVAPTAEEDAYRAASRRAIQLSHLDRREFEARLGQWLARRGFDWEVVSRVVERLWTEATAPAN